MKWEVVLENKHGEKVVVAQTLDWFHALRLVEGVTKYDLSDTRTRKFNQPFGVQWYKDYYEVREST